MGMNHSKRECPLVSVLMTAFNREKYISEAIESVVNSTYNNWELIIVDDRSSDLTFDIAKKYAMQDERIRVYRNDVNLGDYPNRNKAAEYAKGEYLKYLDADDVIYSHGLEVMVNSMLKYPGAALGLSYKMFDPIKPLPIEVSPDHVFEQTFFGHS